VKTLMCLAACAAIAAIAPATSLALPGTGEKSAFVAAGLGGQTLTCTTTAHDHRWTGSTYHEIYGSTTCGGAIQQHCELTQFADNAWYDVHLETSVFSTTCSLRQGTEGEFRSLAYRTVVTAPAGMVWVGAPTFCTGIATGTLDCTLTTGEMPTS